MSSTSSNDLLSLITSSSTSTLYPTDDSILQFLQSRFRNESPYSRLSSDNLIVINPLRTLSNLNDQSSEDYRIKCYSNKDWESRSGGSGSGIGSSGNGHPDNAMPPHPYELAAKVYNMMRRTGKSQGVVYR